MIIGMWEPELIGSIVAGTYRLTETDDIEIFVYIRRKATYEEWVNYRLAEGRPINIPVPVKAYFYEVSTD